MLDLSAVDLAAVVMALEDHSEFGSTWWIDASTGEVWLWSPDLDSDPDLDPEVRADARQIWPLESRIAYGDMEDFIADVPDRRAADLLHRAIAGRGAFRRFKDTLFDFPELRTAWFRFSDTRMRRRAIEFLVDEGLVAAEATDQARAELADPPVGEGSANPRRVAKAVAEDLRKLYGERLVDVFLYGSQARGDAHPDSDIDLAVILDEVKSAWDELRRMDEVLWRHTIESGLTVSATPFARHVWEQANRPLVRAARTEGERL